MLVNPHSESQDEPHEHEQQKYETMQCFAVSEPKSIKEEGDGMEGEREIVCVCGGGVGVGWGCTSETLIRTK